VGLNPNAAMPSNQSRETAPNDDELIRRFRAGDESGFDVLVKRYRQRIHALLYRLVRNPEDAGDLAQDVFVRAYQALPRFKGISSFYTWLYRIAVNQAFNLHRARRRKKIRRDLEVDLDEDIVNTVPARESPQRDLRQTELRAAIQDAVDLLPERQRAVFVLRQYQGLSNAEVAQTLKCSLGAVKANYFFALQKLQKSLKGERDEMS
jgi:RNA polymerase sigma-70 factor, ECF subfamily